MFVYFSIADHPIHILLLVLFDRYLIVSFNFCVQVVNDKKDIKMMRVLVGLLLVGVMVADANIEVKVSFSVLYFPSIIRCMFVFKLEKVIFYLSKTKL